ncbi:hypothetical protein HYV82_01140 [Candidatus Woesearchaeota archaeon]|nr:hypothetical protein [Candidatus Woesearchaeota archaeon]
MIGRKGQAGGAAVLVAAIVGLMLLYILFLPPDERAALLGENTTGPNVSKGIGEDARTLLLEKPGTLFKSSQDEFEHHINSFNLFAKSEDRIIKSAESIYIESTRGNIKRKSMAVSIDPSKTSNLQMSFDAKAHNGRLIVKVNDDEVFNGEAKGQVVVKLDKLNEDNVIEMMTEEVGFQFWQKNFYEIRDFKITGTVKILENLESKQSFIIGGEEANNIERASLIYFVDCKPSDSGTLKVYLNDAQLISNVPDCGSPVKIEADPALIARGQNTLRFAADQGSFLVDQVFVKTRLKEPVEPVYFFEVNATQFSWVKNNTFDAILRMKFVDDKEEKRAELNINNLKTFMDTKRTANFTKNIDSFIVEGNNFIKIVPDTQLNIIELRIRLE